MLLRVSAARISRRILHFVVLVAVKHTEIRSSLLLHIIAITANKQQQQ